MPSGGDTGASPFGGRERAGACYDCPCARPRLPEDRAHTDTPWRDFLYAWGEVRASDLLERDDAGHYAIRAEDPNPFSQGDLQVS